MRCAGVPNHPCDERAVCVVVFLSGDQGDVPECNAACAYHRDDRVEDAEIHGYASRVLPL